MYLHVILGVTEDTERWIKYLVKKNEHNIIVLDYEETTGIYTKQGISYYSEIDAKRHAEFFENIMYYKSFYIYPGMYRYR